MSNFLHGSVFDLHQQRHSFTFRNQHYETSQLLMQKRLESNIESQYSRS